MSHRYLDLHASGTRIVTAAALLVLLSTGLVLYLRVSMHRHAWRGKRPISNAPMGSFGRWAAIVGDENCKNVPRKILVKLNGTAADAAVATMLCICVVLSHACGLGGGFFALHYKPSPVGRRAGSAAGLPGAAECGRLERALGGPVRGRHRDGGRGGARVARDAHPAGAPQATRARRPGTQVAFHEEQLGLPGGCGRSGGQRGPGYNSTDTGQQQRRRGVLRGKRSRQTSERRSRLGRSPDGARPGRVPPPGGQCKPRGAGQRPERVGGSAPFVRNSGRLHPVAGWQVINELLSFELVSSLASAMGDVPLKRIEDYGWEAPPVEDHGSSFVAVFGPDGDAAVMVASLNWDFGSMWLSPSTGVLLNNQLAAFSYPGRHGFQGYPPQAVNRLAPGKRPMSSASPLFITAERDELQCIVAPTGGPLAITGAAQTVMRAMWMGHSIKQAIDCGRLHHPLLPDSVRAEEFVDADVQEGLRRRGHRVRHFEWRGTVHGIGVMPGRRVFTAYDTRAGSTASYDGD